MTQLKSQILGISLAILTGIGCIAYEKIAKNFSYSMVIVGWSIEFAILIVCNLIFMKSDLKSDIVKMSAEPRYVLWLLLWAGTAVTSLLWYIITLKQGAMTASLYEVKFIICMAFIYIMFGEMKFTINTAIGTVLTLVAIYFISKDNS